ncbi:MAG: hypothetical protein OEZ59_05235 [Deltaproteobacteria bacterium]|nr:hypothetical protein [Deltaproteobacteria bacterium]
MQMIPEVYSIGEALREKGGRPVLVGGWVRDMLMGIPHGKDFDMEVFGLPLPRVRSVLRRFGGVHSVGRHFGVLKLRTEEAEYDVSVPRRESNVGKGHKGFWVRTDPRMAYREAASRRDFTINSMGYAFLEKKLIDPFKGRQDLESGILRHVGEAFGEDPLRVLRAMQFAGRFGMKIAPETLEICRRQDLHELPKERIWEEFRKLLLLSPHPSAGLEYAQDLGLMHYFPELKALHDYPAPQGAPSGVTPWRVSLAAMDRAALRREGDEEHDLVLMYAALCHLMGPSPHIESLPPEQRGEADRMVGGFLSRLTNSTSMIKAVIRVITDLDTPGRLYSLHGAAYEKLRAAPLAAPGILPADGKVRRLALRESLPFLLRLDTARFHALHLCRSPAQAGAPPYPAGEWLEEQARRLGVWAGPPEPILKGRHLKEKGFTEGPVMGEVLHAAFEEQLEGRITSLDEAIQWLESSAGPNKPAAGGLPAGKGAGGGSAP